MTRLRSFGLLFLVLGVAVFAGCGGPSKGVKVSGQLVKGGAPFTAPANATVQVQFLPTNREDNLPSASGQADSQTGAFTVTGAFAGTGVQPGKYKVVLTGAVYGAGPTKDLFNGAYAENNTPLTYEVTQDADQKIVIDIAKNSVSKQ